MQVCKKDVDKYGKHLVPCQVQVDWDGGRDEVPVTFYHQLKFKGAKEESYRLVVTLPTPTRGQSPPFKTQCPSLVSVKFCDIHVHQCMYGFWTLWATGDPYLFCTHQFS